MRKFFRGGRFRWTCHRRGGGHAKKVGDHWVRCNQELFPGGGGGHIVYEGFYNCSDICVPVDLFTPSLYKFDVTGKDIEDNHTTEHEAQKRQLFYL